MVKLKIIVLECVTCVACPVYGTGKGENYFRGLIRYNVEK
jgi:hypothetical protein